MRTGSIPVPTAMKAWHFIRSDMALGFDDGRTARTGETLSIPNSQTPKLCKRGMHASQMVTDAIGYCRGAVLCRVSVEGDIVHGVDQIVGRSRTVLATVPADVTLHAMVDYTKWCASRADFLYREIEVLYPDYSLCTTSLSYAYKRLVGSALGAAQCVRDMLDQLSGPDRIVSEVDGADETHNQADIDALIVSRDAWHVSSYQLTVTDFAALIKTANATRRPTDGPRQKEKAAQEKWWTDRLASTISAVG